MTKRVLIPFRYPKKLAPYAEAVTAGGMEPVPADVAKPISLGGVAGLVLMGGTDVSPAHYKAPVDPRTDQPDDERDRVELELIHQAVRKDLPILAICRGLQILNVYHGGNLIQHLDTAAHHDPEGEDKAAAAHEVEIENNSLLRQIASASRWSVNSRHHQAAQVIGDNLRVVARDPQDGVVEALERDDKRFVLAVQWHPEDQIRQWPEQLKLFRRLAEAL